MNKNPIINRSGQNIGHWQILTMADSGHGPTTWNCRCDLCGEGKVLRIDTILKQKIKGKHVCRCQESIASMAKSVRMSIAAEKRKEQVETKSEVAMVTDLRDMNGRQTMTGMYRRRPKRTDAEKGKFEALAYSRAMEARGMVL